MTRTVVILLTLIALCSGTYAYARYREASRRPVRVGVLHSLTGTMAISEKSVAQATLLALEEVNQAGGVLGRRVEAVEVDGRSDPAFFARAAEELIAGGGVCTVFGCWTSASRKTVRPVFERHHHLLFYPVQYEGLEQSPNIVYLGAAPNQQLLPAVKWAFDRLGQRAFLVGSDYVFPRTANAMLKDEVAALRGEVVGEEYLPLGSRDVAGIVARIRAARPTVVFNTINGDSNVAFFHALRAAGLTAAQLPVMSFSLAEDELRTLGTRGMEGHYAAWNYFQSIDSPANRIFIDRFRRKYGADRVTDDPMEAAYFGVHLWAQAVEKAGRDEPGPILRAVRRQSYAAPEGMVYVDPESQHTWKTFRIGRIRADGQFDIVWSSDHPIRPIPYPIFRGQPEWDNFLDTLQRGWGGQWAKPVP